MPILLLLFTIVPLVELWLLIRIGQATSASATILLIIATGVIGAALARFEGMRTWRQVQAALHRGEVPTDAMIGGVLIFVAGLVLVTPGVITDAIGFLFLIPPIRLWVARWLKRRFAGRTTFSFGGFSNVASPGGPDDMIDVEFRDVTHQHQRDESSQIE